MALVRLEGVNRKGEVVRRLKEAALNAKRGSWILGGGWNNDIWGAELPVASCIDENLSGLLIDAAMELILAKIPEVSMDEKREGMLRASSFALTRGVTTVVDFGRYFCGAPVEHSWQDFSGFT